MSRSRRGMAAIDVRSLTAPRRGGDSPHASSIAFGPVRSRRLGWSLGINNVPPKTCSYACVYCQLGATSRARVRRTPMLEPDAIVAAVRGRLAECRASGQAVDYATFVPDGEPTLDARLGQAIRGVARLGLPVAVLTNGSLLWQESVRTELAAADWVSVKVDTVDEAVWRRLNRPVGDLRLGVVMDGMRRFADHYRGELVTETMLVEGVNADDDGLARTAAFISSLDPLRAYVAVPTRPPAEPWVRAPDAEAARRACDLFRAYELPTSILTDEPDQARPGFAVGPDPAAGLLGIIAVHPMTEHDARDYLARAGADWSVARGLIARGQIVEIRHGGHTYLRGAGRITHQGGGAVTRSVRFGGARSGPRARLPAIAHRLRAAAGPVADPGACLCWRLGGLLIRLAPRWQLRAAAVHTRMRRESAAAAQAVRGG